MQNIKERIEKALKTTLTDVKKESSFKDLEFISKNKSYFMQNIERFFELYLFIYCSQLALNLKPNKHALEVPKARELYFILNHETVSVERKRVMQKGYSYLYDRVKYIFPYLSLLSVLSKAYDEDDLRLYQLTNKFINDEQAIESLDNFNKKFREAKKLGIGLLKSSSINEALDSILDSTYEQFKDNCVVDRKNALDKYIKAFEKQVAKPFIQSRGRAGKILVLDQDTIILLTNISIGDNGKLRFQELLEEFENRGIYFDTRSKNELLELFERVGNIERKSDSGDAVYVKTTI